MISEDDSKSIDAIALQYKDALPTVQNTIIKRLLPFVHHRAKKYKQFPNFEDLEQDGAEALLMALNTFTGKAPFTWWLDQYVMLRMSRSANSHASFHIPINKIQEFGRPYKIAWASIRQEQHSLPYDVTGEDIYLSKIKGLALESMIQRLSLSEQSVIQMLFGMHGISAYKLKDISTELGISQNQTTKILKSAKAKLARMIETEHKDLFS